MALLATAGAAAAQERSGRNCLESGSIAELALCIAGAPGVETPEPPPPPGGMCRKRGVTEEELLEPPPMV
ncbi:MAG: hypothetical protein ACKVPY_07785 [Paracoccaceae bacterium]